MLISHNGCSSVTTVAHRTWMKRFPITAAVEEMAALASACDEKVMRADLLRCTAPRNHGERCRCRYRARRWIRCSSTTPRHGRRMRRERLSEENNATTATGHDTKARATHAPCFAGASPCSTSPWRHGSFKYRWQAALQARSHPTRSLFCCVSTPAKSILKCKGARSLAYLKPSEKRALGDFGGSGT